MIFLNDGTSLGGGGGGVQGHVPPEIFWNTSQEIFWNTSQCKYMKSHLTVFWPEFTVFSLFSASHLQPILLVKRWKMVVWGSCRPFLSSYRTWGARTPFSFVFFLVLLAHKNLIAIFIYNFSCSSCAGDFSPHFNAENCDTKQGFFPQKKNFLRIFFHEVEKTKCTDFQREQKLLISAKMWKPVALLFKIDWCLIYKG